MSAEQYWQYKHEHFARDLEVKILHYHANNGRFADNSFIKVCKDNNQGLSYCGVNAHFQNGMAEKWIRGTKNRLEQCFCLLFTSGLECYLALCLMNGQ